MLGNDGRNPSNEGMSVFVSACRRRPAHIALGALLVLASSPLPGSGAPPPGCPALRPAADRSPLPGTAPLEMQGDIGLQLVEANGHFLDGRIAVAAQTRASRWKPDTASAAAYETSVKPQRDALAKMLGIGRDPRPAHPAFEYHGAHRDGPLASAPGLTVRAVRWSAFGDVHGEGLLIEPEGAAIGADIVAIPDAGQTPEAVAGITGDEAMPGSAYALRLAQAGCRVLVPALIGRETNAHGLTSREWLHRPAFVLGRHLLGFEVQKVLTGAECLRASQGAAPRRIGVAGWGEGGLLALYASALDPRIDAACVSGYFGPREALWREPAEHNVFGLLNVFGDAEIAALVAPRPLAIESGVYPDFVFRPGPDGEPECIAKRPGLTGKPGRFFRPAPGAVAAETARIQALAGPLGKVRSVTSDRLLGDAAIASLCEALGIPPGPRPAPAAAAWGPGGADPARIAARQAAQIAEIERHTQAVLVRAATEREGYFRDLKTRNLADFQATIEPYREKFRTDVIGDFELRRTNPAPRSRKYQEGPKTVSYEVVMDVVPGVIAYGILTVPADLDLSSGPKRPVVVCQHGLEGAPQDVVGASKFEGYAAFATRLAERGYVTFAPQNGYRGGDLFRLQQFKAQSIGKTLFSTLVAQHLQIVDWLASRPFVDPDRIAFYGLSYGGKSAMRIPPLVSRYCLSICSGDFNEWVWKNAATDPRSLRYSYANKSEYEIFEWDLGGTFDYAEMAALICPRPFMVERGHFDGCAPDETVASEFAKVRNLYQARLGLGDRCAIEWFPGPHAIHGVGTFEFLDKHLK